MILPLALYLHVPFCSVMCTYCAFNTYAGMDDLIEPYVQALTEEVRILGRSRPGQVLSSIYWGGGTPSLLLPRQFEQVMTAVREHFTIALDAEISLEANPNDLTVDYLAALLATGFNRISIGMQSAVESELTLFNRQHRQQTVVDAVAAARRAGWNNLNIDLIYGSPYQSLGDWETTLRQAIVLQPEHVSLYALELKGGTPLRLQVDSGVLPQPDDDLTADMYDLATEMLAAAGLEQYEISNWARAGFESRHNLQYWRNLPYAGVGAGAHGFAGGVRYSTILLPARYIEAVRSRPGPFEFPRTPATAKAVKVDRKTEIAETLMMGLRLTREGISLAAFQERFGVNLPDLYRPTIEKFVGYGLLHLDSQVLRLTQQGRFLSNAIFRELI